MVPDELILLVSYIIYSVNFIHPYIWSRAIICLSLAVHYKIKLLAHLAQNEWLN